MKIVIITDKVTVDESHPVAKLEEGTPAEWLAAVIGLAAEQARQGGSPVIGIELDDSLAINIQVCALNPEFARAEG